MQGIRVPKIPVDERMNIGCCEGKATSQKGWTRGRGCSLVFLCSSGTLQSVFSHDFADVSSLSLFCQRIPAGHFSPRFLLVRFSLITAHDSGWCPLLLVVCTPLSNLYLRFIPASGSRDILRMAQKIEDRVRQRNLRTLFGAPLEHAEQ